MFCDVWKWAGKYRKTNKNIGVDKQLIAVALRNLIEDTRVWLDCHTFEADELAVRFHHRLVFIHPFPNGNGRHARLMTDVLIAKKLKMPLFTWGSIHGLGAETQTRAAYIHALRAADKGDFGPLIQFVRT
jgi:Fic-DOC domain mobile mystery protein B